MKNNKVIIRELSIIDARILILKLGYKIPDFMKWRNTISIKEPIFIYYHGPITKAFTISCLPGYQENQSKRTIKTLLHGRRITAKEITDRNGIISQN